MNEANTRQKLAGLGENPVENLTTAIELYELARTGFEEGTPDYAGTQMNEANARQELAERGENSEMHIAEAAELYTKAIQTFDRIFDYESLRKASETQAELYRSSGELEKAYESYTRAIEAIEEIRETVRQGENREEFFSGNIEVYRSTVLLALTLDKPEQAFEYVEKAKSRVFLDKLADTSVKGGIPEELAENEKQLKEKIADLRRELDSNGRGMNSFAGTVSTGTEAMSKSVDFSNREQGTTLTGHTNEKQRSAESIVQAIGEVKEASKSQDQQKEPAEVRDELQEVKQELQQVQAEIKEHDPEAYTLRSVDVASLAEIQAELRPDEQLLEYFLTDEALVIFLTGEHELVTEVVSTDESGTVKSLSSVIEEYRTLIKSGIKKDVSEWQSLGNALYEILIRPVKEQLTAETLVMVPHGSLHTIPLAALYDGERYLAEQYQLRVLANASTLRFLDMPEDGTTEEALVVGDPRQEPEDPDLKYARKEAKQVAELHDAEALIGPDATKPRVEDRLKQADLSHLACHAEYDSESPAYSRILLAETVLSLEELFELEVGGELVTLAACETALGEASRGDEVQSLARGFQYAGAPSVIGTLWQVKDEYTPAFFREFYTADGTYAERLQQAQLSFIQAGGEQTHPYHWSGFHLYGSP